MQAEGQVGYPGVAADGADNFALRQNRGGMLVVSDGHGRYTEMNRLGNLFQLTTPAAGVTLAAANASVTAATAQPVVGLVNPVGSGVYASIMQAIYGLQSTGASDAEAGIPVWQLANISQQVLTGSYTLPFSLKTLTQSGAKCNGLVNQPLTGNAIAWQLLRPFAGAGGGPITTTPTASINVNTLAVEPTDGLILVPPGFALGLFVLAAGTTQTAAGGLSWEEIPSGLIL